MHTVPPSSQAREGGEGGWATTAPEQLGRHSRGEEEAEIVSEPRGGKKKGGNCYAGGEKDLPSASYPTTNKLV